MINGNVLSWLQLSFMLVWEDFLCATMLECPLTFWLNNWNKCIHSRFTELLFCIGVKCAYFTSVINLSVIHFPTSYFYTLMSNCWHHVQFNLSRISVSMVVIIKVNRSLDISAWSTRLKQDVLLFLSFQNCTKGPYTTSHCYRKL